MRPNIDVPWGTHGKIREYADAHELSVEEAYLDLIDNGLRDFNQLDSGRTISLDGEPSSTVIPMDKPDRTATSPIFIFAATEEYDETGWLEYVESPTMVVGNNYTKSMEDFRNMCERIAPHLENGKESGDFTISHESGQWVGRGLDTFYQTFRNKNERHSADEHTELGDREEGIFVAPVAHSTTHSKHVIVNATQIANPNTSETFKRGGVAVVVNGYPFGRSDNWYSSLNTREERKISHNHLEPRRLASHSTAM